MKYKLLIGLFLFVSCAKKMEMTNPKVETITESVYASGTIKSNNQYQVFATVSGTISEVYVKEGSLVKKGSVLMKIKNETALLNVENANLLAERAKVAANQDKLKEALTRIESAAAKKINDSLLFVRQQNLKAQGVGTQVELEQRELNLKNSKSDYQLKLLAYQSLQKDLLLADIQSKNNVRIYQSVKNEFFIKAISDGKVYKVLKEKGELVTIQNPVAIIGNAENFYAELNVDEYDIAKITFGQLVLLSMDSYKGKIYRAKIESVEPLMDTQSRSFLVTASFLTRPPQLYPNLSVEANIVIQEKKDVLTIPRNYLIGDSLVLVGEEETRRVIVGIKDYRKAEIVRGLKSSDVIYKIKP
ncbi:MAG: efflux RND transporter periplasmic adaptor subunit [Cyclobacteriaceae bacterium]|nr:efflux RND transporter periplasmic adaptor subunit [Cyclobacteriaceae bacterium]